MESKHVVKCGKHISPRIGKKKEPKDWLGHHRKSFPFCFSQSGQAARHTCPNSCHEVAKTLALHLLHSFFKFHATTILMIFHSSLT